MTPKEKAKELFDKYCFALKTEGNEFEYWTNVIQAKQCALICVDEILNNHLQLSANYWNFVKEEIEKL